MGTAMMFRRDVALSIRGFEEDFFFYYEDHDFGTRIVDFSVSGGSSPGLEADSEDGDACSGILPGDGSNSDQDEGRQEDEFDLEPGMEGPEEQAPVYDPPAGLYGAQDPKRSCGLGFELCLLLPLLLGLRGRRREAGSGPCLP